MLPRRPFSVTLLMGLVLILTMWGTTRLLAAIRWWDVLYEFGARLSPLYLAVTGTGWVVVGCALLWGILRRKRWIQPAVLATVLAWQIEFWVERAIFESPSPNLPFAVAASCILIGLIMVITFHSATRYYLTRSEEHEQPDQHPEIA